MLAWWFLVDGFAKPGFSHVDALWLRCDASRFARILRANKGLAGGFLARRKRTVLKKQKPGAGPGFC